MRFEELNLSAPLLEAIAQLDFTEMTEIQEKAIPLLLEGKDVIGKSNTGTGKTAAFSIPILEQMGQMPQEERRNVCALILCPTRELAMQACDEIRKFSRFQRQIKPVAVYGGASMERQIYQLKNGANLVVGTPGRVLDHLRRRTLKLDQLQTIVLDEADEMLNMGFREDIEFVLSGVPEERQTVLFSATMPKPIMEITKKFQNNAKVIKVTKKELTVPNIEQYYYDVKPKKKEEVLSRLLDIYSPRLSVVFCNTKKQVDLLVNALLGRGYFAAGLHGDMKQEQRDRVMQGFRTGKTEILVATDVAARGIDVDEVEAVFNYDLPQDDEYYVHRIGRTGRAGREGRAFSFVSGKEVYKLKEIQRYCKTKIYAQKVPSLNDVANTKMENILDDVERVIEQEDLDMMINAIEERVNNSEFTAMDMAAAFLKICCGMTEDNKNTEENDWEFGDTGAGEDGMVRLFINIGKKQRVRPGDILGAIAGESGMDGKLIGTIDMYDKYTFVEVPREYAREVLNAMKNVKIKGKTVAVEPANQK